MDAKVLMASAALDSSDRRVVDLTSGSNALYIERSFDETPVHMDFGAMAELISPFARYIVPAQHVEKLSGKTLCSYNELMLLGVAPSTHGVVDIGVHDVVVCVVGGSERVKFSVGHPPRIMLGKTAGHCFEGRTSQRVR